MTKELTPEDEAMLERGAHKSERHKVTRNPSY